MARGRVWTGAQALERKLAWTAGRLEFRGERGAAHENLSHLADPDDLAGPDVEGDAVDCGEGAEAARELLNETQNLSLGDRERLEYERLGSVGPAGRFTVGETVSVNAESPLLKTERAVVSISGVGDTGPYVKKRVYDPIIQGLSGFADIQSQPVTNRPQMIRTIVCDKTTAVFTAQAVAAALYAREKTGQGDHIRVAMLDTMISYLWPEGMMQYTVVGAETTAADPNDRPDLVFKTSDGGATIEDLRLMRRHAPAKRRLLDRRRGRS